MAWLPNFSLIHAGCPEFSILRDYIFLFLQKENERNWTFTGDFPGGMEKWECDGLLYPPIFSVRFSPPENLHLSLGLDTLRDGRFDCSILSFPGPAWGHLFWPQHVLSVSLTFTERKSHSVWKHRYLLAQVIQVDTKPGSGSRFRLVFWSFEPLQSMDDNRLSVPAPLREGLVDVVVQEASPVRHIGESASTPPAAGRGRHGTTLLTSPWSWLTRSRLGIPSQTLVFRIKYRRGCHYLYLPCSRPQDWILVLAQCS